MVSYVYRAIWGSSPQTAEVLAVPDEESRVSAASSVDVSKVTDPHLEDPVPVRENPFVRPLENQKIQTSSFVIEDPFAAAFNRQIMLVQGDSNTVIEKLKKWVEAEYCATPQYARAQHYLGLCIRKIEKQSLGALADEILEKCITNIQRALERELLLNQKKALLFESAILELNKISPSQVQLQLSKEAQLRDRVKKLQWEIGFLQSMSAQPLPPSSNLATPEALERVKLLQQKAQLEFERIALEKLISQGPAETMQLQLKKVAPLQDKVRKLEWEIATLKRLQRFETTTSAQQPSEALRKLVRGKVQRAEKETGQLNAKSAALESEWKARAALCKQKKAQVTDLAKSVDANFKKTVQKEEQLQTLRAESLIKIEQLQKKIEASIEGMAQEPERLDQETTKKANEIIPQINSANENFYTKLKAKLEAQKKKLLDQAQSCLDKIGEENTAFREKPTEILNAGVARQQANEAEFQSTHSALDKRFDREIVLNRNYYVEQWNRINRDVGLEQNSVRAKTNQSWTAVHQPRYQKIAEITGEKGVQAAHKYNSHTADTTFRNSHAEYCIEYGRIRTDYITESENLNRERQQLKKEIRKQVESLRGKE